MFDDRVFNLAVLVLCIGAASCKGCHERRDLGDVDREVDEGSDPEEADDSRDNFWRARIAIIGHGNVATESKILDCSSDGVQTSGKCGPELMRFKERTPPLLRATAAPDWKFDHWDAVITARTGSNRPRAGRMPDGVLYLDGFGYADTGELETVTAVFTPAH
jgi:hypothetical protein